MFCLYILHQTLVVLLSRRLLKPLALVALPEGLMLIALTFALSGLSYVLARRVPVLALLLRITRAKETPDVRRDLAGATMAD